MTDNKRIKAYVIKRDDGKYFHIYDDWEEVYKENLVGAYIFRDEPNLEIEVPQYFKRCQVVPITIQEGDINEEIINLHKDLLCVINNYKFIIDALAKDFARILNELKIKILNSENVEKEIDQLIKEYGGKSNAN